MEFVEKSLGKAAHALRCMAMQQSPFAPSRALCCWNIPCKMELQASTLSQNYLSYNEKSHQSENNEIRNWLPFHFESS